MANYRYSPLPTSQPFLRLVKLRLATDETCGLQCTLAPAITHGTVFFGELPFINCAVCLSSDGIMFLRYLCFIISDMKASCINGVTIEPAPYVRVILTDASVGRDSSICSWVLWWGAGWGVGTKEPWWEWNARQSKTSTKLKRSSSQSLCQIYRLSNSLGIR